MPALPERVPLNNFLDGLPADVSESLREIAGRMLLNEQAAIKLRGVEMELRPFFIFGVGAFLLGLVGLVYYSEPNGFLNRVAGGWPLLMAALGFLPGLIAYYAIRIRKRSQADLQNFELNKQHFLPHGAIYFPSDSAASEQMVTLVEAKEAPGRRSKYDRLKPGAIW